uniref:FAD-binding oxidoreductase n=1 Tax=Subtercola endophyticus TaxID=2895559 RepID=UPI0021051D43|nr:FAD-binding oxidoreductase [Subtercola endophyticus]
MIDRRPEIIARCLTVTDVVTAVRWARAEGVPLTVRGGGHSIPGHSVIDDGLVIDLTGMNAVEVDPAARLVRVQGGALLGDVDRATQEFGLATPAGAISHTGAGGLILGGGLGWTMRKYGLTVDNLIAAQLVTAEGDVIVADRNEHQDLFWALRGGGGNFGVVTEFTLKLHERGPVYLAAHAFELEDAAAVLRGMRDIMPTSHDDLVWSAFFRMLPDWDWAPAGRVGDRVLLAPLAWLGDHDEGRAVIDEYLAHLGVTPLAQSHGSIPYVELQSLNDDLNAHGHFNYHKSSFLKQLDDDTIDVLVRQGSRIASANSQLEVLSMGGAIARIPETETAFAHRTALWPVNVCGIWKPHEDSQLNKDWVVNTFNELRPHLGDGSYLNFGGSDATEVESHEGYGDHWRRLREVKTVYDPGNIFRHNANIPPLSEADA